MASISTMRSGWDRRFTPISALVGRSRVKYLKRSSATRCYSSTSVVKVVVLTTSEKSAPTDRSARPMFWQT